MSTTKAKLALVLLAMGVILAGCDPGAAGLDRSPPPGGAAQAPEPAQAAGQGTAAQNTQGRGVPIQGTTFATTAGVDVAQVYTTARPTVVNITASAIALGNLRRPVEVPAGTGTGVIFDAQGYILTNNHVVAPAQGGTIRVTLADDRSFEARVVDSDPANDLAIIKIDDASGLTPARLGDSDRLQVGEPVVAIGHALALPGGPTVSAGVVSAVGRTIQEPNGAVLPSLVQTDAAINPGNSGGPLLNANAEVIGINTAGIAEAQGISFAVAINQAKPAVESVLATGRVTRPFLGVAIVAAITPAIARANDLPAERGVLVEVVPGGPAARAGMRDGDIIVEADGQEIRSTVELQQAIRKHRPGEPMRLRVQRQGANPVEVTATLEEQRNPAG
ncbi:MAG TPA: trypsin-like peptidase domain-containing protein [Chloroflexota bacterium]|nr:trypsin-like peptidase domain-containing protein [Chloroflexota bacterium]